MGWFGSLLLFVFLVWLASARPGVRVEVRVLRQVLTRDVNLYSGPAETLPFAVEPPARCCHSGNHRTATGSLSQLLAASRAATALEAPVCPHSPIWGVRMTRVPPCSYGPHMAVPCVRCGRVAATWTLSWHSNTYVQVCSDVPGRGPRVLEAYELLHLCLRYRKRPGLTKWLGPSGLGPLWPRCIRGTTT